MRSFRGVGWLIAAARVSFSSTPSVPQSRFGGQTGLIPSDWSPKRDWGPKILPCVALFCVGLLFSVRISNPSVVFLAGVLQQVLARFDDGDGTAVSRKYSRDTGVLDLRSNQHRLLSLFFFFFLVQDLYMQ